ncbi:endocuticle structural glycoprotein SgAbd-5-like [Danaus plexippus]|uniref:endocuticle structural glycoprotein SgAbd-5-like n=1 Tax=Danaus plexippus TaxID=13037 RepID=UPI002AB14664|nr:endocuticle structural glycoprotein SgAbd-5-like [Danaus plexippus]
MKLFLVLACVALATAAPKHQLVRRSEPDGKNVEILRYDNENDGLGSYKFGFELSDQTKREEQGELKNAGSENEFIAVKGSYSWVDQDGQLYTVNYVADENGFQPTIEQSKGGAIPSAVLAAFTG